MLRVLNLYFSEMIKIAEEYGGTVEKNTGDGLMAYFEDNSGEPKERMPHI
jgi:adenylate cyclase